MSLSEKSRNHLYTGLCKVVEDEEAVQEMLTHFPASEAGQPATREDLRVGLAEVRTEIAELRTEVRGEIAELRSELRSEIARLEGRMDVGFARADSHLVEQMALLRAEIGTTMRNWTLGGMAIVASGAAAIAALARIIGGG